MVILPPLEMKEYTDAFLSGKIFLGPSDRAVYLNLAGDTKEVANDPDTPADEANASVGELFLVSPETFRIADNNTEYGYMAIFKNENGDDIKMMGLDVPIRYSQSAQMGLMGFTYEVIPDSSYNGIFSNSAYTPEDFFNSDSNAGEFWQKVMKSGKGFMSLASGIKLMGPRPDNFQLGHTNRNVFGNVLSRFFVFTFWHPTSGRDIPLQYDENRDKKGFPKWNVYGQMDYTFEPANHDHNYQDFMSRMVSGSSWTPTGSDDKLPEGFMAYNSDAEKKTKRIFGHRDFFANDGFTAGDRLENLARRWFKVENNRKKFGSGIEVRVGKTFETGDEFLEAAGIEKGQFNVNGVVYIAGPLKVPPLKMTNDKIGGGIVLVDGPIELDNITRGYNIDTNQFKLGKYGNMFFSGPAYDFYQKWKTEITQESFLTFVSLSGDPITIKGEALIGVHLVNLSDKQGQPYSQIKWEVNSRREIVYCGGIACNYLDLPERMKEFGYIKNSCNLLGAPFFIYHSAMAAQEPALAVQMMENMRGYMLTASKAENDE
jgi:hypothetical protein